MEVVPPSSSSSPSPPAEAMDVDVNDDVQSYLNSQKFRFHWKIEDFSEHFDHYRRHGTPKSLKSPDFVIRDVHDFGYRKRLHPRIVLNVHIDLAKTRGGMSHISFTLKPGSHFATKLAYIIHSDNVELTRWSALAFTPFVQKEGRHFRLENLRNLKALRITVKVEFALSGHRAPPTLRDDLIRISRSGSMSDVKLVCADGRSVPAHKFVLMARSDVFRAMLTEPSRWSGGESGRVRVIDMSYEAAKVFVDFLVTDAVDWTRWGSLAPELLAAGDMYNIRGLKLSSADHLASNVDKYNCINAFLLGDLHHERRLKIAGKEGIKRHFHSVAKTKAWKDFKKSNEFKKMLEKKAR